jgi:hypothetical protein
MQQFFNQGWVGVGISGIFFALTLLAGYIWYARTLMGARPVFQQESTRLVGKKQEPLPQALSFFFNGKPVPRLTKSYIVFWNSGVAKVEGKDVVDENPVRLQVGSDGEIVQVEVLKETNLFNKVQVHSDSRLSNEWVVTFDYLDPSDGVVLEVYHTAMSQKTGVVGTIKGVKRGIVDWGEVTLPPISSFKKPISIFLFVLAAGLILLGLANEIFWKNSGLRPLVSGLLIGVVSNWLSVPAKLVLMKWIPKDLTIRELNGRK